VGAAPAPAPSTPVNLPPDGCHLPPVRVSADREIRTVVGLRPFRPSGFRVAVETFGETRVVHNYGHGGGGITLSWGTAKLAIDLGLPGHAGPVAVLGAGAVGLATAHLCQQAGFDVTIYAKALPPNTTSNIAGGQWEPSFVFADAGKLTAAFTAQYIFACKFAYERYQILMDPRYGVRWMRNYVISRHPLRAGMFDPGSGPLTVDTATDALSPEGRVLRPEENPFGIGHAAQFDGMLIETPIYLEAMLTDVRLAGGKVIVREMHSVDEVRALPERLVFNCTGLGAGALFGDTELTPLRGQLTILLPQPEVTYATSFENTYMFSRRDGVLLGGSHEMGDWSLEPNLETKAAILAKQAALFASMRTC
jgi:glycine/D-amino acid oxidase-like deaminating enzyme